MKIARDESGKVLKIGGELSIETAEELRDALRDFVGEVAQPAVDLSGADGCDAVAVQLLCSARKTADRSRKALVLVGVSGAVVEASTALGLPLPWRGHEDGI